MHQTLCALLIATTTAVAQSDNPSNWVGVWQGELDRQPSVVLTLAQDNGNLEGTLVLNIISRGGGTPHIIAHEPHALVHPHLEGATLSFRLKRIDGSSTPMDFTAELIANKHARIHCHNCGEDAPVVEMTKQD
jgi:hypothetical protein